MAAFDRHTAQVRWLCKLAARGVVASTLLYAVVALAVLVQALELTRWGALPSGALGLGVDHFAVSGLSGDPSASGLSVTPDEVATLTMRLRARNGLLTALAVSACSLEVRGGASPVPVLATISLPSPTILSRTSSGLYPADCGGGSCLAVTVSTASTQAYLQTVLGLATGMRQGPGLPGNASKAADLYGLAACTLTPTLIAPPGVGLTASLSLRFSPSGLLASLRETGSSGPGGTWSFAALAEWSGIGLNGASAAGVFATAAATVGADSIGLRLPVDPTGDLLAWYDERQTRLAAAVSSSSSSVPSLSLSPSSTPAVRAASASPSPSSPPRLPLLGVYTPSAGGAFGAVYSLAGVNTSALLSPTAMRVGALLCRAVDNDLPSAHDSGLSLFLARVGVVAGVRAGAYAVPPGTTVVGPGQADEIGGSIVTSGASTTTDLSAAVQTRVKYRMGGCDAGAPAMGVSGSVLGLMGPTLDVGIVVGRAGSGAVAWPLSWRSRAASVRIAADCDMEAVGVDGGVDAAEGSRGASPNAVALLRHLMLGLPLPGPAPVDTAAGEAWSCHPSSVPLALVGGAGHPFARLLHGLRLCILPPWLLTVSGVRDSESLPGRGVASALTRTVGSRTAVHTPLVESSTLSLALGTTRNHVSAHALSPAITWPEAVGMPTMADAPSSGYVAIGAAGNETWAPAELHSALSWSSSLLGGGAPSSPARVLAASPPSLPVDPMGGMAATFASYIAGSVKAAAWEEVYFDGTDPRDVGSAVQDRCSAELGRTPVAVLASCCAPASAPPSTSLYFRGTVRLAPTPMRTVLFSSAGEPSPIVAPVLLLWHPAGVNASTSSVTATLRPAAVLRLCVQTASDVAPPTMAVPGAQYAAGEKMWLRMTASITVLDSALVWGRTGGAGDATTLLRSLSDVLLNGASAAQAAGGNSSTALPPSVAAALDAVLGVPAGRSASAGACEVRPPPSRTSGIDAFLSTGLLESAPPSPNVGALSNKWTGHGPWAGTAWRVSLTDPVGLAERIASVCAGAGGSVCPASLFNASSLGDSAPSASLMSRLLSGIVGEVRMPGPGDGRVWAARPQAPIPAAEACAAAALAASPTLSLSSSAALSLLGVGDVTGGAGLAGGAGIVALITDLLAGFPGGFPGPPASVGWQDYNSPTDTDAAALAATPSWAWAANASLPAPPPSSCPLSSLLACPPSALTPDQRSTYTQGARIECGLQLPPALCASWRAALNASAAGASTSAVLADAFPRTFTPAADAGAAAACASLLQAACGEGADEVGGFLLASRSIKLPVVVMNVPSFEIGMLSASLQVPSALPPGEDATRYGAHGAKLQVQFDKRSETLGWQTLTWDVALSLSRLDPYVGSSSRTRADGQPVRVRTLPAARATLLASLLTRSRLQTVLATVHRGASIAAPLTLHPASEEEATALVLLTAQAIQDAVIMPTIAVGAPSCPAPASSVRVVSNPTRALLRTGAYGPGKLTDSGMVVYTLGHTLINALPGMPTTVTGIDGLALSFLLAVQVDGQASLTVPLLLATRPNSARPPVCSLNLQLKASGVVDGRFGLSEAASSATAMDGDDGVVTLLQPAASPDGCARSIAHNASAPLPPILTASVVASATRLQVKDIVRGSAAGWMRHLNVQGQIDTADVRMALAAVTPLNTSAAGADAAILSGLIRDAIDAGIAAALSACGWTSRLRACASLPVGGPSVCISLLPSTSTPLAVNPALFHAVSGVVGVSANGLPRVHVGPSSGARSPTLSPLACPDARQLEEEPAAEPAATAASEPAPPILRHPSGPRRAAAVSGGGIVVSIDSVRLGLNPGAQGLIAVLVLLNLAAIAFLTVEGRWAAKEGAPHSLLQEEDAAGLSGKRDGSEAS